MTRGRKSPRMGTAAGAGISDAIASIMARATGVTCTGSRRSSAVSSRPSRAMAPSRTGSEPCPARPRKVARARHSCFSATIIG